MADTNDEPTNPQYAKKSAKRTPEQIGDFLERTGFVFEMRMNEIFLNAGYATKINEEFLDLEQDTLREIDITAAKTINGINIRFAVECKQSATDKWIFLCNKRIPRRYRAVKVVPKVDLGVLRKTKLFAGFHTLDPAVPLANNYLCYTIIGDKKAEHRQIDECVYKLPKALVDLAAEDEVHEKGRYLFFPLALFSG